jgi:hypothetical protein
MRTLIFSANGLAYSSACRVIQVNAGMLTSNDHSHLAKHRKELDEGRNG